MGDGPLPTNLCNGTEDEENTIEVPHVDVQLTEEQFSQLQSQIVPINQVQMELRYI